eukprot:TRINITY_DN5758_c0_g1_i1.p1 TRINITY_DN5758_c0_g1~~TRINITY_DN5758_c0_g1_i1.p1  ORF type:complete len:291 (-),score=73.21 TRINITY_DN5758_c0_g1_i1:21-893(-)
MEEEKGQWSQNAGSYSDGFRFKELIEIPFVSKWFENEERLGEKSLLDVGCGAGAYSSLALGKGIGRVVGLDLAPEMISLAQKNVGGWVQEMNKRKIVSGGSLQSAEFHVGSASSELKKKVGDEKFDFAILIWVLCNMATKNEVNQTLKNISSSLKPNGKLLIMDRNPDQLFEVHTEAISFRFPSGLEVIREKFARREKEGSEEEEEISQPMELQLTTKKGEKIQIQNWIRPLTSLLSGLEESGLHLEQTTEVSISPAAWEALDEKEKSSFAPLKDSSLCLALVSSVVCPK